MSRKLRERLNVKKVTQFAVVINALQILAMGGVYEAKDAIEFLLAGATAVAVGTATFTDPSTTAKVYDGIVEYCERQGVASVSELSGAVTV